MNFMDVVYVILWAVLALYCYVMAHKVHKILYLAGVFFTFMFAWNLVDLLIDVNMQAGIFSWIYKGVSIAFLAVFLIIYWKIRQNRTE